MAFRKLLTGWVVAGTACVLSVAHAASLSDPASASANAQLAANTPATHSANGPQSSLAGGPLGSANVPRIALDDAYLPVVPAS
ncbi:hypothetical protein AB3X93_43065, partial [Paraburkholderia sp. BR14262]